MSLVFKHRCLKVIFIQFIVHLILMLMTFPWETDRCLQHRCDSLVPVLESHSGHPGRTIHFPRPAASQLAELRFCCGFFGSGILNGSAKGASCHGPPSRASRNLAISLRCLFRSGPVPGRSKQKKPGSCSGPERFAQETTAFLQRLIYCDPTRYLPAFPWCTRYHLLYCT